MLSMQFFYFAIVKYVSALIDDMKMSIKKFGQETSQTLSNDFIEVIKLHGTALE